MQAITITKESFKTVKESSLAKEIYKKIKESIISGQIPDGSFLTLAELSSQFGVSKTPVRDALNALEIEGYLKSLPRKGYLLVPITRNSILEYCQMRFILEREAVILAIQNASDDEILNLNRLAQNHLSQKENITYKSFNKMNNIFHLSLLSIAHNSVLKDTCNEMMDYLSRVMLKDCKTLNFQNELSEHVAITEALMERSITVASDLITVHIHELIQRIYASQRGIM